MKTIKIRKTSLPNKYSLEVFNAYGRLCAVNTGTYAYIYRVAQYYKKEGYKCR